MQTQSCTVLRIWRAWKIDQQK